MTEIERKELKARIAKLPKWAREHIATLNSERLRLFVQVKTMSQEVGETNVCVDSYFGDTPLPKNSAVRFTSKKGVEYRVHLVSNFASRDDEVLSIWLRDGLLGVVSGASNSIYAKRVDR